jgi:hypothetical protein
MNWVVISQKTLFFIVTAVEASNLAFEVRSKSWQALNRFTALTVSSAHNATQETTAGILISEGRCLLGYDDAVY